MLKSKILHIATDLKFISPFIDTINKHDNINQHKFILITKENKIKPHEHITFINNKLQIIKIISNLNQNNKIILHGLFSNVLIRILFFQPWVIKRCYWVMHGGDFYFPEKQNWVKKQVIKKIRHFITYLKGDFEYVKKWYGAQGKYHECFMYPSNLYKQHNIKLQKDSALNIQVGNSADPTNKHIEVFEKLRKYKNKDIRIYVPLSYGDQNYANIVIAKGQDIFGDKFMPITDFMPMNKYLNFLGNINIAIFAHERQQAMGNIITLLGLGKKIYIRESISSWQFFKNIDVRLFDYPNIELDSLDSIIKEANIQKIKSYFSKETYVKQLKSFLN